jgi:competence protein ComFC
MKTDPLAIVGPWRSAFSLAPHSLTSEFLGYNEQGHPKFDTVRSDVGERLYQLKYRNDVSAVAELATVAADFVRGKAWPIDLILPLPPSRMRVVQPVAAIAEAVANRLGVAYSTEALRKTRETPELKSMAELEARMVALSGAFAADPALLQGKVVLIFDDLYRSGASMQEAARAVLNDGAAKEVFALALTRTRSNR